MLRFALAPLAVLLAACTTAPPPAAPPCPTAAASASAAPSASAVAAAPPAAVRMQPPQDAAAAGLCTRDELKAARAALDAIEPLVRALPRDASAADPVTERMAQLYASRCYVPGQLSRDLDISELKKARALSVALWWERGGNAFFRDALDHANAIHVAPSIPRLLAAEQLLPLDPLHAVVCPSSAAVCDPLAQGAALDINRELQRVTLLAGLPRPHGPPAEAAPTVETCAAATTRIPPEGRLVHYADCVDHLVARRVTLPDARYRSPKGWLVLRGRRGHYNFCDEARAYDLETGTAYIASRCAGLVLGNNGAVHQDATRAAGTVKTQVGTLSPDALRRLALVLWLKNKFDDKAQSYAKFSLPTGVPLPDRDGGYGFGTGSGSSWAHSGQTTLEFEISDGTRPLLTGTLRWPDSADLGDQTADDLVVSAEATLQEGCPKIALPAALAPASSLGGVSGIDASPDALRKNADDLTAAFAELRKTKVCKK